MDKKSSFITKSEEDRKRPKIGAEMGKKETNETMEGLTAYWQLHRNFDANIADLARYVRVSRDTVYRWLNKKAQPKEQKLKLIQEWLDRQAGQQ